MSKCNVQAGFPPIQQPGKTAVPPGSCSLAFEQAVIGLHVVEVSEPETQNESKFNLNVTPFFPCFLAVWS